MSLEVDYALIGGGLQNGLIALALRAAQPDARIALIERGPRLGGNHTWCFHAADVPADAASIVEPLVVHRWDGYDVAFPDHARTLPLPYAGITAERFDAVVRAALPSGSHLLCDHQAIAVTPTRVVARGPDREITVSARAVIDARGPDRGAFEGRAGYQKFVGLEVQTTTPHGLSRPILMDARVDQQQGYRFLYVLPLAADRLLLEDTYFHDSAYLDLGELRGRISAYAASRGWSVGEILREESGVLPMPWHADLAELGAGATARGGATGRGPALVAGYQGGWFHAGTGYSFPVALRLALAIAHTSADELPGPHVAALWRAQARQLAFAFRLNWMLFRWFAPENRLHVLARFYRLPEDTIARFYAFDLSSLDKARLFLGRPPRGMSWRAALAFPDPPPATRLAKEPR